MAKKILAINGSYRKDGVTAQALAEALAAAGEAGAQTETVDLVSADVRFCTNCRACTQEAGALRAPCVIKDGMDAILDKVDAADGLILAAPVNCFNVTAVTRRFMERLVVYGYWPWGMGAPKFRVERPVKKAVLITSTAMPSFFARFFTGAMRALKYAARTMGAKVEGKMYIGLASMQPRPVLSAGEKAKARALGRRLALGAFALLLAVPGSAGEITQKDAQKIAEAVTAPVRNSVVPAANAAGRDLYDAMLSANAAAWALRDLVKGVSRKAGGAGRAPDAALADTYMRLRMRSNTGDLCPRHGGTCRRYPADAEFSAAVKAALGEIKTYLSRLDPGEDAADARHRRRVENFLETARRRALFSLPATGKKEPALPALTPGEEKYRGMALAKKSGGKFAEPVWP